MTAIPNFPTEFQEQSLATLTALLPVSYSIFALVDPSIRSQGMVLQNIDNDTDREYQTCYCRFDPLHPSRFKESRATVVCLDSLITEEELSQSVYYQGFMQPHDMRYVTDMFLRRHDEIVAIISVIRNPIMKPFSPEELDLLSKLHPLLEFSLNCIYTPRRLDERCRLAERFQLTPRELDVVEHLVAGLSNTSMADIMYVSLSTVKTHLQHIYEKLGVESRTQLIAKIHKTLP